MINMEKTGWKILAIILIVIQVIMVLWIALGFYILITEEEKVDLCYYDVCSEYADAWIEGDVCFCYEYDLVGELVVAKTELMK